MSDELNKNLEQEPQQAEPAVTQGHDTPEANAEQQTDQAQQADSTESSKLPPELQEQLGKTIAAVRKRYDQKLAAVEQELSYYRQQAGGQTPQQPSQGQGWQQQQAQPETVYDPDTGEYIDANSAVGQLLLRQQKIKQRKEMEMAKQREQQLTSAIQNGYQAFGEQYDQHLHTFGNAATVDMANALSAVDDPAAVINFLGANQGEIQRIKQLSPEKQWREIIRLENRLNPTPKMVSQAAEPVSQTQTTASSSRKPEDQDLNDRYRYYLDKRRR